MPLKAENQLSERTLCRKMASAPLAAKWVKRGMTEGFRG
jgi:hypothetical protein